MRNIFLILSFFSFSLFSQEEVKYTLHNLSSSGPGKIKSNTKKEICNFCHTTHNAEPQVPLWGHEISSGSYIIYFSKTLDSFLYQPSGTSKLCLSCHDGTVALWKNEKETEKLKSGNNGFLGIDFSGHHPFSFYIDEKIIEINNQKDMLLKDLNSLKKDSDGVNLNSENKMECTTCHNPHKNLYPQSDIPFGKKPDFNALCLVCHLPSFLKHEDPLFLPKSCKSCHKAHGEQQTSLLEKKEPELCYKCHGTTLDKEKAIRDGFISYNASPSEIYSSFIQPITHPLNDGCSECHKLHWKEEKFKSKRERENILCGECHQENLLFQNPISFHYLASKNDENFTCSTCHRGQKNLPKGVHGSVYKGLIYLNYETEDGLEENQETYELCYHCHNRENIFKNSKFPLHQKHIVIEKTSCFTCHNSHASLTLPHLLSIEEESRRDRISPTKDGKLKYESYGEGKGACFLNCHNFEHNGLSYGIEENNNLNKILKTKKELYKKNSLILKK